MNLNKTIKAEVTFKLTVQAHRKQAGELVKRLKSINDAFWGGYSKKCQDVTGMTLPKLKQMAEMNIITRASHFRPRIRNNDGGWDSLILFYARNADDIRLRVLAQFDLTGTGDLICRGNYGLREQFIGFKYPPHPLPMVTDMHHITNGSLVRRLKAAHAAALKLCDDIQETHDSLTRVLSGYRTVKRLAEDFPEAAKLVPAPKAPANQMVSKEEVDRVRALVQSA